MEFEPKHLQACGADTVSEGGSTSQCSQDERHGLGWEMRREGYTSLSRAQNTHAGVSWIVHGSRCMIIIFIVPQFLFFAVFDTHDRFMLRRFPFSNVVF